MKRKTIDRTQVEMLIVVRRVVIDDDIYTLVSCAFLVRYKLFLNTSSARANNNSRGVEETKHFFAS